MNPVIKFVIDHQEVILFLLVYPVITAVFNYLGTRKTDEQWEQWALQKPFLAFLISLSRSIGVDPFGFMRAFRDFSRRRAGQLPTGAKMPPALEAVWNDPAKREVIEKALEALKK